MKTAHIAPPNSLLLIMDRSVGQIPESMGASLVAATSTCIAIGTLSEHDGTTQVTLDGNPDPTPHGPPVFDGLLETPSRELTVNTVLDEVVLRVALSTQQTRVLIWANDGAEPSEIRIVVAAAGGSANAS